MLIRLRRFLYSKFKPQWTTFRTCGATCRMWSVLMGDCGRVPVTIKLQVSLTSGYRRALAVSGSIEDQIDYEEAKRNMNRSMGCNGGFTSDAPFLLAQGDVAWEDPGAKLLRNV